MGSFDSVEVFKGMVAGCMKNEYAYYEVFNDSMSLSAKWGVGQLLCDTGGEDGV